MVDDKEDDEDFDIVAHTPHEPVVLTLEEAKKFWELIQNPQPPTPALLKLFADRRKNTKK